MTAVAAIDADMRRMTRASEACRRLMTIPGVGQLTKRSPLWLRSTHPSRVRRSRDIGAYLGLVPRNRHQSGEGRLHRRHLEMRGWAGAEPSSSYESRQCHADPLQAPAQAQGLGLRNRESRSTMRKAKRCSARAAFAITHATRCFEMGRSSSSPKACKPIRATQRQEAETSSQEERRPREGADDGVDCVAGASFGRLAISTEPRCTRSLPHQVPNEHAENAGTRKRRHPKSFRLDPLENGIRKQRSFPNGWRTVQIDPKAIFAQASGECPGRVQHDAHYNG